jgi:hypothetical protein
VSVLFEPAIAYLDECESAPNRDPAEFCLWGEAGAGVSRKIVAWPSGSSRQSWVTRLAGARTNSAGQWRRVEAAGLGEPVQILALLALTVIEFAVKVTTLRRNSSALLTG